MKYPCVRHYLDERNRQLADKTDVTRAEVIDGLKRISGKAEGAGQYASAVRAHELLGKAAQAFTSGEDGAHPKSLVEALAKFTVNINVRTDLTAPAKDSIRVACEEIIDEPPPLTPGESVKAHFGETGEEEGVRILPLPLSSPELPTVEKWRQPEATSARRQRHHEELADPRKAVRL